ncbi:MAG: methyltransferase domain-containing protein [Actinomycetota bacterium]|nr:methyltransferase domain-containing protein [Actinomycetota bacterium]
MGLYNDHVMPRLVGVVCANKFFDSWRRRVCEGLEGDIIELGFGSGANVPFLPDAVRRVVAVEPSRSARVSAEAKLKGHRIEIEFVDLDRPDTLGADTLDGAVFTFTLCSVDDPGVVLRQLLRVLKPGAPLHFLEHGLSPDARTAHWQHRLNGLEQRLAGGCQLIRDPLALIGASGFDIVSSSQGYAQGPKPWSYFTMGVAKKPLST